MDSRQHILWTFAIGECPVGESLIGEIREPHIRPHLQEEAGYNTHWSPSNENYRNGRYRRCDLFKPCSTEADLTVIIDVQKCT